MEKQLIVSISREFGSGGRDIAKKVAEDMGLELYDRNMLEDIAEKMNIEPEVLEDIDEKPRNKLLSRRVNGHSNSMEENLAQMQFEYLRRKADQGESFVVVGRCSETILKDREGLVSIFIVGDKETKINHTMEKFGISREEAVTKSERHDRSRRRYHNHYSDFKWGDSRNYDMCINSSRLGMEGTAGIIDAFIKNGL